MVARSTKPRTGKTDSPSPAEATSDAHVAADGLPLPDAIPAPETELPETELPGPELPGPEQVLVPEPELEPDRLPQPEPVNHNMLPPVPEPVLTERPVPPPQVTVQKVGLGPVILGGIVAAALGYAAAYFGQQGRSADLTALMTAQTDRIAALEAQVAALPAPVDLSPLNTAITDMQAGVGAGQAETTTALAMLETRLAALEKAPNADGTLSATAISAWDAELQNLRADIAGQQARMQEIADAATTQLDQTRVEAATIEQSATESAAAVTARAALARVQAALDAGTPFDTALGDLAAAVTVPEPLTAVAAKGVPTMMALQTDFPDAARAALATARSEGLAGEDGGGIAAFLRNQFDVRSVTPQEGTTVDAILSRAEDDLRQNRLSDSLAEVASLPEVVRAEMVDWTHAAEARIAAIAAVEGLSQSLTSN